MQGVFDKLLIKYKIKYLTLVHLLHLTVFW